MTTMMMSKRLLGVAVAMTLAMTLATPACESGGDDETTAGDTDASGETEGPAECDPVGATPEVGALLNAPLEADVEVIVKTPQHPGVPGPVGLP